MWTLNWKNTKKSRHSSQSREERDKVIGIFNFALILILSLSLQLELDIFTFHVRDEGEAGQVCPECAGVQGVPEDQEESWQKHRLKFRKQYSFKSLHLSADGGLVPKYGQINEAEAVFTQQPRLMLTLKVGAIRAWYM